MPHSTPLPPQQPRHHVRVSLDDPARLPTPHRPGSPEKVDILVRRAERDLPLWLAGDASLTDETRHIDPPPAYRHRSLRERIQGVLQRDQEAARKRAARAVAKGGRA